MSVQFGKWNLDGKPVDSAYIEKVKESLSPYGLDGGTSFTSGNIVILYHAFHTTKESHNEVQPHICASGTVITWDGRLDNRADLISELRGPLIDNSTDVAIVAKAFEEWGTKCFGKLIGDWAISIWHPVERRLILAKDPIGTRHLYYSVNQNEITWSTLLDPVVRLAAKTFKLDEEYVAGWLSLYPAVNLTPYTGVHTVPPSSFVQFQTSQRMLDRYWCFDPDKRIRYSTDAEYEEHFRTVFATAVRRRLRSDRPVLAELSGGRDSSSIICLADDVIAGGAADLQRLDTVSYFDDSEPTWNERPYFTKVEEKRGVTGWHINVGLQDFGSEAELISSSKEHPFCFPAAPGIGGRCSPPMRQCLTSHGNRVLLSGFGGDEVMGGVPTAVPELEDLLATVQLRTLTRQLKAWALHKRVPWFYLLIDAVRGFLPICLAGLPDQLRPAPWLTSRFVAWHRAALSGYPSRVKLFGAPPSFQENVSTLEAVQRQLTCKSLPFEPHYEKRYPYLDRSLLEFLFAIPREQLIRPTQRRSLLRRALTGIVPDEILNRKRKAYVLRAPRIAIARNWNNLVEMTSNMLTGSIGIVDTAIMLNALQKARSGEDVPIISLLRTINVEAWLRSLRKLGLVALETHSSP